MHVTPLAPPLFLINAHYALLVFSRSSLLQTVYSQYHSYKNVLSCNSIGSFAVHFEYLRFTDSSGTRDIAPSSLLWPQSLGYSKEEAVY